MPENYKLNDREMDVIYWLSIGKSTGETAEIICVSRHSICMTLHRIYNKLGTFNAAGMIGFCFRHGILKIENNEGRFE